MGGAGVDSQMPVFTPLDNRNNQNCLLHAWRGNSNRTPPILTTDANLDKFKDCMERMLVYLGCVGDNPI